MKRSISFKMCAIILIASAWVGCSKSSPSPSGGGSVIKYPASFTSQPVLDPDTLYARTAGTLTWVSAHTTNTIISMGTLASNNISATIPALETSSSATITLTGEDGALVSKVVPIPVYDTMFTFICRGGSKWKEDGDTTFSTAFPPLGYQVSSPDLNLYIFYKTIVNGKRSGTAIAPSGSTSTGWWNSLNNGAQFQNGGGIYNNIFLSETKWIMERSYSSGGFSFIRKIHYKVVP